MLIKVHHSTMQMAIWHFYIKNFPPCGTTVGSSIPWQVGNLRPTRAAMPSLLVFIITCRLIQSIISTSSTSSRYPVYCERCDMNTYNSDRGKFTQTTCTLGMGTTQFWTPSSKSLCLLHSLIKRSALTKIWHFNISAKYFLSIIHNFSKKCWWWCGQHLLLLHLFYPNDQS